MLCSPVLGMRKNKHRPRRVCRPWLDAMESRLLLSFLDGNGAVVTAVTELPGSHQLVITFDGGLQPGPAAVVANYQVTKALTNPELVTRNGPPVRIISASYSDSTVSQVTLTLKESLKPGVFYRIFINGTPASMSSDPASNPLVDSADRCSTATTTIHPAATFTVCSRSEERSRLPTRAARMFRSRRRAAAWSTSGAS